MRGSLQLTEDLPVIVPIRKYLFITYSFYKRWRRTIQFILAAMLEALEWQSGYAGKTNPTHNSRADDWPKVLSLRTLLVRSVQHLVTYIKMFVCMSSFRIRLMTLSLMSTNRVTALEPYIPIITDY